MGFSKQKVTPAQASTGQLYDYANTFVPGPPPAPNLQNSYSPDPGRLHAPIRNDSAHEVVMDPTFFLRTPEGRVTYFGMLYHTPAYFVLPGAQSNVPGMRHGWSQTFVPSPGMRAQLNIQIPQLILSQPIRYDQSAAVTQPVRKPMKGVAPKAHN